MKKILILAIAAVALVACLAIARWADQNTRVPASTPGSSSTTAPTSTAEPQPTTTAAVPGDIENGLGWG